MRIQRTVRSRVLTVRRWDIPPGPLDLVNGYKRTIGVDVTLSLPAETVAGFKSRVNGLYTDKQALRALLVGTGLSYQTDNTGRVNISVEPANR